MTYLDHAATSWPKPPAVVEAVALAQAATPDTWDARYQAQHALVAKALGTTPGRLLLTPGCTSALGVALADLSWQAGDRVLISGMEHHALHRAALLLRARDVEVVVAPRASDGPVDVDFVARALKKGVRALAMCAATNTTGEVLPIKQLVTLAREAGTVSVLDAAQLAGWSLDLAAVGADLVAFAGHKGLQAPWGIGGLVIHPSLRMKSPRVERYASLPGGCDVGSVDRVALAGLAAGVAWLGAPERAKRLSEGLTLAHQLRKGLEAMPGVTVLGGSRRIPTLAVTVEGHSPATLAAGLAARGVRASGGRQCSPLAHTTLGTPDGVLRLSLGPTSTAADVEVGLGAMADLLGA